MNRRILKKLSKKALPVLLGQHADYVREMTPFVSDGEETIDAPTNFPRRQQENGFSTPLKGTPMFERRTIYEYEEYDWRTAYDELLMVQMNESAYWENVHG